MTPDPHFPPDLAALVDRVATTPASAEAAQRAIAMLDLTSLNDDDTAESTAALCDRASTPAGPVAAICIWPRFVPVAWPLLAGSSIRVACVANFPAGDDDAHAAAVEAGSAVADGADEIDVVMPYRRFLAGDTAVVHRLLSEVREAARGATLKVILETGRLGSAEAIVAASELAIEAGADFIKTSTGKLRPGATLPAVALMLTAAQRSCVAGRPVGVKAAGGVRTTADAAAYLALADAIYGREMIGPSTFRFGASGVLTDLLATLGHGAPPTPRPEGY